MDPMGYHIPAIEPQDSAGTKERHAAEDPAEPPQDPQKKGQMLEPCLETSTWKRQNQHLYTEVGIFDDFCQKDQTDWSPFLCYGAK